MFCNNCGTQLPDTASFCSKCGNAINRVYVQSPPPQVVHVTNRVSYQGNYVNKSKWTTFVLCLFLGWLGVHRFYVGKTGTGLLWLFTAGFLGVGAFIDLIIILCDGFRDKMGQPLV